ncbi:MAG: pentapeptide repeat-containing protein [Polyangiaceae bacterium]|nr:pentapeptide repeat-containing protein [Polyangiaceae bacterium]
MDVWHEGRLLAGDPVGHEGRAQLDRADVVVLLVSPDFVASDRLWKEQIEPAMGRSGHGEPAFDHNGPRRRWRRRRAATTERDVTIVPIRIRSIYTKGSEFDSLLALPRDGGAIGTADNDAAWVSVIEELASALFESGDVEGDHGGISPSGHSFGDSGLSREVERLIGVREGKRVARCLSEPPISALWEIEECADPMEVRPVAFVDGAPSSEIVLALDTLLQSRYGADNLYLRATLIHRGPTADRDLVKAARALKIELTSFDTFNQLIDFRRYLDGLRRKLTTDPTYPPSLYIDQQGCHLIGRDGLKVENALDDLFDLVTDPRSPLFLLVLADFGTGKTFLLRKLAERLAEPGSAVTPILVELRAVEKDRSLNPLLMQHFALAGETAVDLNRFYHLLERGRVALLFDGFDELVPRVTFDRAAEHLETLMLAARGGSAKVVITSRTQHFLSTNDIELALAKRAEQVPHRRIFKLLPFDDDHILRFLTRRLESSEAAQQRFALLRQVTDLIGLSQNPRMLSFIVDIDDKKLLAVRDRAGTITKADLYTLLVEKWIVHEFKRHEYRGVPTLLNSPDRWRAVLVLAERLWGRGDKGIDLKELPEDLRQEISRLGPPEQDAATKAFAAATGTLLVRDDEGRYSFLHRSILEFAAAWAAAVALRAKKADCPLLSLSAMSDLMAEFFGDLAEPEKAAEWAKAALHGEASAIEKSNAELVLKKLAPMARVRLGLDRVRRVRRGEDLRGQDFSGQDLREADFTGADLSAAVLVGADLTGALLTRARLVGARLKGACLRHADLRYANLSMADLCGADLTGAQLEKAVLRYAKLLGLKGDRGALEAADTFGASPPHPTHAEPTALPAFLECSCAAFSPDGLLIAGGYGSGTLALWNAVSGELLRAWAAHTNGVTSVAFSPDGLSLASASWDHTIALWNVQSGARLRSLQGHQKPVTSVAFSPDGLSLASASTDNTIALWNAQSGARLRSLQGHTNWVTSVAFSPDGLSLASASHDFTIALWNAQSGARLRSLQGHTNGVTSVAFSPDGLSLASASTDNTIALWNAQSGARLRSLQGHKNYVTSVAFSPDGLSLASASTDNTIALWNAQSGARLRSLQGHKNAVTSVAFSHDGLSLASASGDGTIALWNAQSGARLRSLQGHKNAVTSVAFSPDGLSLASASHDFTIALWNAQSGARLRSLQGHTSEVTSVAFSPDKLSLASASDDNTIALWNAQSGALLRSLQGHNNIVTSVAFSPDGLSLASASYDTIALWNAQSGAPLRSLQGHTNGVTSVAFSPDGLSLASASHDTTIALWNAQSGARLRSLQGHKNYVTSVAFSPDGLSLASASYDTTIALWNAQSGARLRSLQGHTNGVTSVAFSPDGLSLASASLDKTIALWNAQSGGRLRSLQGHTNWVSSVAFSPDGLSLASASWDGTIRLWHPASGRCLAILSSTPDGWVAFTPDGRYKLSENLQGSFWHVIGLCRFDPGELDEYLPHLRIPNDQPLLPPHP